MPKLTGETYVPGENGEYVLLREGDELPEWADMVGDHLLDEPRPKRRARRRSTKTKPQPKDEAAEEETDTDSDSGESPDQ